MSMSDFLEGEFIKHLLRSGTFTKPTTVAIALLTTAAVDSDTGEFAAGTGVEVVDAFGYSRQTLNPADGNWSAPTGGDGMSENLSDIVFGPAAGGAWGTIVGIALTSSATHDAGEVYLHGTLTSSVVVSDGDTFKLTASDLKVALD